MCPATDGKPTSKRRKEGLPEYEIREFDTDGALVRADNRSEYFPVLYVEPETLEGTLAGLDLASGEVVREAIEQAKASGEMVVTGQFIVARETEEERGVIVLGPVYRPGAPVATPQERARNLIGLVASTIRVGPLVQRALSYFGPGGINVWIFERLAIGAQPPGLCARHVGRPYARGRHA